MDDPRAVGWMKYFDGRIVFVEYDDYTPDYAECLGWERVYTDDVVANQQSTITAQQERISSAVETLGYALPALDDGDTGIARDFVKKAIDELLPGGGE